MDKEHWGDYVLLSTEQNEGKEKKAEKIKMAVGVLLDKASGWPVEPDFDTMQIIVHEGWQSTEDGDIFWGMTVGLKTMTK